MAVNACCEQSSHRLILGGNGELVAPETFAIDWLKVDDGRVAEGDGSENSQFYGYGATIRAAAGGRVVTARDDLPEVQPGTGTDDNPTLQGVNEYGGNDVVIRMGRDLYALYGHMIPGSVRVKEGERVETGDRLGLLGNTGNTSAPHLHFGLIDGRVPLASNSLPFEIDHFRFGGIAGLDPTSGLITATGDPDGVREAYPLSYSLADY